MTTIYLVPRGKPSPFASWHDPRPRLIAVTREDNQVWEGRPVDNPACPYLVWPKFAWAEAEYCPHCKAWGEPEGKLDVTGLTNICSQCGTETRGA